MRLRRQRLAGAGGEASPAASSGSASTGSCVDGGSTEPEGTFDTAGAAGSVGGGTPVDATVGPARGSGPGGW
eukprot:4360217-Prymnesium_polylepis.1